MKPQIYMYQGFMVLVVFPTTKPLPCRIWGNQQEGNTPDSKLKYE